MLCYLLVDNINNINKNIETLFVDSKEVGLEINAEKTMYVSLHHN
jgi:hypothetical protein